MALDLILFILLINHLLIKDNPLISEPVTAKQLHSSVHPSMIIIILIKEITLLL